MFFIENGMFKFECRSLHIFPPHDHRKTQPPKFSNSRRFLKLENNNQRNFENLGAFRLLHELGSWRTKKAPSAF